MDYGLSVILGQHDNAKSLHCQAACSMWDVTGLLRHWHNGLTMLARMLPYVQGLLSVVLWSHLFLSKLMALAALTGAHGYENQFKTT